MNLLEPAIVPSIFILSVIFYGISAVTPKIKNSYLEKGLATLIPGIVVYTLTIFIGGELLNYVLLEFIVFNTLMFIILGKLSKRLYKIIFLLLFIAFIFPKPSGDSGFMSTKGHTCTCIGFRSAVQGIDTSRNYCHGIPVACHETEYDLGLRIPDNVGNY